MKNIENRLEKLESTIKPTGEQEDLSLLTDEELDLELAGLIYNNLQEDDCIYPDVGQEVKAMSREEFISMYISMDKCEEQRLYRDPLYEWARKEGIEV